MYAFSKPMRLNIGGVYAPYVITNIYKIKKTTQKSENQLLLLYYFIVCINKILFLSINNHYSIA